MSETPTAMKYWVDPSELKGVSDALSDAATTSTSSSELYEQITPLLVADCEVRGIDNIPSEDPLIVIKNHPFHFDFFTLNKIFAARPDIRYMAKVSPLTRALPSGDTLLMRKQGSHAHIDDIRAMQAHLALGGSLMVTPWGSLDHQAKDYATLERTIKNVIRYASYSNANILPVNVDATWGNDRHLPLDRAVVAIQEPIMVGDEGPNTEAVTAAVTDLYERYAA